MKTIIYLAAIAALFSLLLAGCTSAPPQGDAQAAPMQDAAQPGGAHASPSAPPIAGAMVDEDDLNDPVADVGEPTGDAIPEDFPPLE